MNGSDTGGVTAGMLRGAVAGAAGVWAMDRVDWFLYGRERAETRRQTEGVRPGGRDPAHVIAGTAAKAVGVDLASPKQNPAGLAAHYSLGILPGALYGALRDRVGYLGAGRGLLFGLGLFVVEDELANPLLGTAAPPGRYPWQAHARGLVAHLAYGVVTDVIFGALSKSRHPAATSRRANVQVTGRKR